MFGELLDPNDRQMCLLLEPDEWDREQERLLTRKNIRRKVNPMLGLTVQHAFYEDEIAKARQNPEKMNEVVSKLFNVYQSGKVTEWLKADEIRALQVDMRIDDCTEDKGWVAFAGLDFSKGDDLNGSGYLAYNLNTGMFFADIDAYMSEAAVNESPLRELFLKWSAAGWLHVIQGKTFDPAWPVNRIIELHNKGVNFIAFGYDPYNAKTVTNALGQWVFDMGLDPNDIIIPVSQGFATYNAAVMEFDFMVKRSKTMPDGKAVADPLIHFSKNPLLPWEFSNTVLKESSDGMGNVKPVKGGTQSEKIDNVQMILTALLLYDRTEASVEK